MTVFVIPLIQVILIVEGQDDNKHTDNNILLLTEVILHLKVIKKNEKKLGSLYK